MNSAIARKNEKDVLRQMSERMLSGWALKAHHCPLCNTALMGKAGDIWCVSCDLPVRMEADIRSAGSTNFNRQGQFDDLETEDLEKDEQEVSAYFANYDRLVAKGRSSRVDVDETQEDFADKVEEMRGAPVSTRPAMTYKYTSAAAAEKNYNTASANNDTFASLEESKKEYDRARKSSSADKVSSLLGEKMLAGWTLMSQSCPTQGCGGTPLVRQAADGAAAHLLCVSCNGRYIKDVGDRLIKVSDLGKAAAAAAVPTSKMKAESSIGAGEYGSDSSMRPLYDMSDAPILKSFQEDKNDPSYKMSQKLLQGWALLDKVCSAGSCAKRGLVPMPLMKNRDGDLVCVQCDHVISASASDGTAASAAATAKAAIAPPLASRMVCKDDANEEESVDDEDFFEADGEDGEGAFQSYMAQRLRPASESAKPAAATTPFSKPTVAAAPPAAAAAKTPAASQRDLQGVLLAKISETKDTLQSSSDLDVSLKAAKLLEQLIITYKQAVQM